MITKPAHWSVLAVCATLITAPVPHAIGQPFIRGLGTLRADDSTAGTGISADGRVVVGYSRPVQFNPSGPGLTATRWVLDAAPDIADLGRPAGWTDAQAAGTSQDGSVVFGWNLGSPAWQSFRSVGGGQPAALTVPAGWTQVQTRAITPDGSSIFGTSVITGVGLRMVRWDGAAEPVAITPPAGATNAFSPVIDGTGTVYSAARFNAIDERIVRHHSDGATSVVGTLPTTAVTTPYLLGVSANGSTFYGARTFWQQSPQRDEMFVVGADGLPVVVPVGSGFHSTLPTAALPDGSVIFGYEATQDFAVTQAFAWSPTTGKVPLAMYFTSRSVDLTGWTSLGIAGVSGDGTRFAGSAVNAATGRREAVVIVIPAPGAFTFLGSGLLLTLRLRR